MDFRSELEQARLGSQFSENDVLSIESTLEKSSGGTTDEWMHEIEWRDGSKSIYLSYDLEGVEKRKQAFDSLMRGPSAPARITLSYRPVPQWELVGELVREISG